MLDHDALRKTQALWPRGWGFIPKSGWRKIEGGVFYPSENRFGEVFSSPPENPVSVRHPQYMYEVGYFQQKGNRISFCIMGRGMTWEEAFDSCANASGQT